ncbi:hypothetical protein BLNAU_9777 [Blattamonas nauphoetae]|uniref:Uncharacterized protein n=1 Tax=Blattamonas nauphoetae TaxID=2049346 RepID=A0ABQ9XUR9_9EUKA|nr:hypothetical protein BLNAU_9777 [Blattamonas nauphoetae]
MSVSILTLQSQTSDYSTLLSLNSPNLPLSLLSSGEIVSGSTVTRINSFGWAGCFTKTVSKGIHRLSIKTKAQTVMLGILDAAEFPKLMTADVSASPKAAMMYSKYGSLWSADKRIALNAQPEKGQEWSAEADLEKRTLHFFIDGVQQQHHFVNLPVPLVFALDVHNEDGSLFQFSDYTNVRTPVDHPDSAEGQLKSTPPSTYFTNTVNLTVS